MDFNLEKKTEEDLIEKNSLGDLCWAWEDFCPQNTSVKISKELVTDEVETVDSAHESQEMSADSNDNKTEEEDKGRAIILGENYQFFFNLWFTFKNLLFFQKKTSMNFYLNNNFPCGIGFQYQM